MAGLPAEREWYRPREMARLEGLAARHGRKSHGWRTARKAMLWLAALLVLLPLGSLLLFQMDPGSWTGIGWFLNLTGLAGIGVPSLLATAWIKAPGEEQWHREQAVRAMKEARQLEQQHQALLASLNRSSGAG